MVAAFAAFVSAVLTSLACNELRGPCCAAPEADVGELALGAAAPVSASAAICGLFEALATVCCIAALLVSARHPCRKVFARQSASSIVRAAIIVHLQI